VSYTINPLAATTGVTLTPSPASPQTAGATVGFTAAGSGGTGSYQYQFWVLPPGGSWSLKQDYSSTATWSWSTTSLAAGTYQVCVWVRTAGTTPVNGDTYKIVSYTINPLAATTGVTLTPSPASPQTVGATVGFTAAGSGGTGNYEYQFWVLPPGGNWTSVRAYSSTATWTWNTTGGIAGTYQVCVWARTAGTSPAAGYDTYKIISYVFNPIPATTGVTLTPSPASPQTVGATVVFTAAGSGGTGNYEYQFWVLPPGGTWTSVRDYSSTATWSWNTTGGIAGTYQICVWARTAGTTPAAGYDTYKIVSYVINP